MFKATALERAAFTLFRSTWAHNEALAPASVLFLPFLNSTPKQHAKYMSLWAEHYEPAGRPVNVLVATTSLDEFLSIERGVAKARAIHETLDSVCGPNAPVAVHSMSVGSFMHAVSLVDPERGAAHRDRICGQIFDSVVYGGAVREGGLERIVAGVAGAAPPPIGAVLGPIARAYLSASPSTVDTLDRYIFEFSAGAAEAPALFVCSDNDTMCDIDSLASLMSEWREQGRDAMVIRFASSPHADHLRKHPVEFRGVFFELLSKLEWDAQRP